MRDKIIKLVMGGGKITGIADDILALEHPIKTIEEDECNLTVELCPYPDRNCNYCDERRKTRPATIKDLIT